ncbi:MAG: UDP-2,3-diacylglucosamine diphosphatase [Bacteroidales bacterium]
MNKNKKYFISDLHLGLHPVDKSLEREKLVCVWLEEIKHQAKELYLVGDIFDFWHEYKHVVPRGFTRFLGKIAELADGGTRVHFFSGNHDVWMYGYFESEIGAEIHHKPLVREFNGKKYFLAHGDGLGKGELGYKLLVRVFRNNVLQWLFARLHPNFALWLGKTWSIHSRYAKGIVAEEFAGEKGELLIQFAKKTLKKEHYDVFVFGHRHIPYDIELGDSSRIINLGDWIYSFTYGVIDEKGFELKQFRGDGSNIIRERYSSD